MAGKNKNPNAKYAFIGLIVALIACIATGLIGSANILTSLGMFNLSEAQLDGFTLALQISIGLLILGLASYAILSPDSIRRFLTGRQARYGSNSLILALAFFGILFAVNYIVYNNTDLLGSPWDFTEDKSNTLAPETLQVLATLPDHVTATAFYSQSLDSTSAEELLQKFKENSDGKFTYSFVNPDTDPVAARQAGITGDGKILLQMGEVKEIVNVATETELAKTMVRLIDPVVRGVYFLEGHGEGTFKSGDERSFSIAKSTLEEKNYTVNTLNLLTNKSIPEDAEVIIVAGPQKPLSQAEVNLLKEFVNSGGSLVVMEDASIVTEFGDAKDPLAEYLQKDWGITINNDVILDFNSQSPLVAISAGANTHPITQNLSQNYAIYMPNARSLTATPLDSQDIVTTPLIFTSPNSYSEMNFEEESQTGPTLTDGVDTRGPLIMAVAGENTTTKGRVLVTGNSIYAIDVNFDVYGNGNFFINSVDWSAERQDDVINLTTRPQTQRVFLPPSQISFLILALLMIIVIPGLVVFFGISSWISRRRKG
ncbi:MAG: ABC-type uncharacterized transport system [Chloroflexi bacterium OLB14]|nr:MAG: ABC-type uncharacterized transport system [Chloroflexi bacterium OLB14]